MPKVFLKSRYFKNSKGQKHLMNHLAYLHRQSPLFSGTKEVDLNTAYATMRKYANTVCWRHIYSLTEEDANRLEIDRDYMKVLMESQKNEIAKALHISPENLILYASYHNVAHHPHLHFITRSKTRSEGYIVCPKGITLGEAFRPSREAMKSTLTNEIFREYLHDIKVKKSDSRKELNEQFKKVLEIGKSTHCISEEITLKMQQLQNSLETISGKKVYGYLPSDIKVQVDDILETIIRTDSSIKQLYQRYYNAQKELINGMYVQKPEKLQEKMDKWQQEFFHPQKSYDTQRHNIIIRHAIQRTQQYKKEMYQHKTRQAAARSMLYHIGQSLQEDTRRLSGVQYYSPLSKPKHMVKKIQKEIIVDQVKSIEVGGKL